MWTSGSDLFRVGLTLRRRGNDHSWAESRLIFDDFYPSPCGTSARSQKSVCAALSPLAAVRVCLNRSAFRKFCRKRAALRPRPPRWAHFDHQAGGLLQCPRCDKGQHRSPGVHKVAALHGEVLLATRLGQQERQGCASAPNTPHDLDARPRATCTSRPWHADASPAPRSRRSMR